MFHFCHVIDKIPLRSWQMVASRVLVSPSTDVPVGESVMVTTAAAAANRVKGPVGRAGRYIFLARLDTSRTPRRPVAKAKAVHGFNRALSSLHCVISVLKGFVERRIQ